MCGLFGIASTGLLSENEKKFFEELGKLSTSRGRDSTGVATIKLPKIDKEKGVNFWYNVVKDVCEPSYFFNRKEWKENRVRQHHAYLGHNRAATIGKITKAAAHPFQIKVSDGEDSLRLKIIGMHNGTIHDYLTDAEEKEGTYLSDSHKFYTQAAEKGFREALLTLKERSSYCFVFIDSDTSMPTFFRNTERPLWIAIANHKRTIAWASEKRFLEAADKMHSLGMDEPFLLAPNALTKINLNGDKVVLSVNSDFLPKEKIELHQKRYTTYSGYTYNNPHYNYSSNSRGIYRNGTWYPNISATNAGTRGFSNYMSSLQDYESYYDDEELAWRAQFEIEEQKKRDAEAFAKEVPFNDEIPFRPDEGKQERNTSSNNIVPFLPKRAAESEIGNVAKIQPLLTTQCGNLAEKKLLDIEYYSTSRRFKVVFLIKEGLHGSVHIGPTDRQYEWASGVYRFFEHERLRIPFVVLNHDDTLWVYLNSNPRKAKIKKIGKKHPNHSGWWNIWEDQESLAEGWLTGEHRGAPIQYEDLFTEPGINYNYMNKLAAKYTKEIKLQNKQRIVEALQKKKKEEEEDKLEAKMKKEVDNFLDGKKDEEKPVTELPNFLLLPAVKTPTTSAIIFPNEEDKKLVQSVTEEEILSNLPGLFRSEFGKKASPPLDGGTIARLNRGISKPPFSYYDNGFGQFSLDRASIKLSNGCDCCSNPKVIGDLVWWLNTTQFICNECWTVEQWKEPYKGYTPKRGKWINSKEEGIREVHVG